MLCQNCNKNEATTHIKQNINGERTEMHLCPDCAKELGVLDEFEAMNIDSMFGDNFFGNFLGAGLATMNSLAGVDRCSYCGSSFNDIVNTGNVGCANCYTKFYDKLEPSIRKIHGKTKHIGKYISYTDEETNSNSEENPIVNSKPQKSEIRQLKDELKQAIKEQRFEDAAVLRDKIKDMRRED